MAQTSRLVIELDSRDAEQKAVDMRKALEGAEKAGASLNPALKRTSDAMQDVGKSADKATKSIEDEADELERLLGQIDPVVRRLGELDKQEQALARHRKAGKLDTETYTEYQTKITETRNALTGFSQDLNKTGVSAAQTTAALRQMPAQITDIFTSLAGGQNPLLVLIQQGGQIKDSFGGIANTAEVLGGKVKGLFSSLIGSTPGMLSAGAALGELAMQQQSIAETSGAAADGIGGIAESANTATDAAKNANEAAVALSTSAGAASTGMLALVGTVAAVAAALGLLIYGYKKGSQEASEYTSALILNGNSAGTTANQLSGMARRVGEATTTVGDAAAVLALLASSSKIPVSAFESIATAALNMEDATGKAAAETVAEFVKIAEDPTKALAGLSEKYGIVTAATYEQVRALQEQGDKQGAATIAEDAYAKALDGRSAKIKASLGTIEAAWDTLSSAAKKGWDSILDVGREQSLDEQIDNTKKLIEDRKSSFAGKLFPGMLGADSDSTRFLQDRLELLEKERVKVTEQGKAEGEKTRIQREGQKAFEEHQQNIEANFTKRQKMNKELEEEEKRIAKARAAGYTITAEQEAASLKAIRENEKYKEAKGPKAKAYTEDAGLKMLDAARQTNAVLLQQNASIDGQGIATQKLGAQAQALIKWEQQLADIKGKQTLTADQKSLLASQDLITAQLKKNAGLEREAEIQNGIKQANDDQVKLLTLTGQLREANKLKSGLDDAQQMAEYERQGNTEAAKRLETLIKIRDINLNAAQKPGTIEGVTKAPTATGLDPSVGGADSEVTRLNEESARLDQWRATELQKQKAYLDLKAINEQTYAERIANINNQAAENRARIEQAKNTAIINQSSSFFGIMATLSQSGHGKLAEIGKAAAMAQATIDGYLAVQKALAAFPPPFNFIAAGVVGVATAANVSAIAGIGFSNGGYTGSGGVNDPAGTVHKGEVVWSQDDIRKAGGVATVEAMRKGNVSVGSGSGGGGSTASSSSPVGALALNQVINVQGSADSETLTLIQQAARQGAQDGYNLVLRDLKQNGPARQMIARNR